LSSISAPFGPALSAAPNDYTITLNFVGGGLGGVKSSSDSTPYKSAIDQEGNIWVVDAGNAGLAELSNLGAPLSPSTTINANNGNFVVKGGYRPGFTGANTAGNVQIDLNGNVWIADYDKCLIGVNGASSGTPGATLTGSPFGGCTEASQVAVDASNNIWVMGESFILSTTSTGSERFNLSSGFDVLENLSGADYTGHMWYNDIGNGSIGSVNISTGAVYEQSGSLTSADTQYTAMGNLTTGPNTGYLSIWEPQAAPSQNISPVTIGAGQTALDSLQVNFIPPTLIAPTGIAADGRSSYYLANQGGQLSTGPVIPANITVMTSKEGLISPSTTGYTGGSTLVALDQPQTVNIDQSGNVWVVNQSNPNNGSCAPACGAYLSFDNGVNAGNLIEFVGLAQPVNPVFAADALAGTNAMNAGASATSVMSTPGSYGNLP